MVECTAQEAAVIDSIKAWPGVPAIVTFWPETGWSVRTREADTQQYYQANGIFDKDVVEAEYRRLCFRKGWTFMMCPEARLKTARIAIVGLNPGGGGDNDAYAYGGNWDTSEGNAYFQPWAKDLPPSPMSLQVQKWHDIAGAKQDETFCAQFVPFRSPDWERLGNFNDALSFSRLVV